MTTIRDYAASRGISYDRAYRATKAVFQTIGKTITRGKIGTDLTDSDMDLMDRYFKGRDEKTDTQEDIFFRDRPKWLEAWTAHLDDEGYEARAIAATIVLILRYTKTRWTFNRTVRPGQRVGDLAATICYRSGVEKDAEGNWTGFTLWLLEHDYRP